MSDKIDLHNEFERQGAPFEKTRESDPTVWLDATQRLGQLIDDWFSPYLGEPATDHIGRGKRIILDDSGKEPPDVRLYRRMLAACGIYQRVTPIEGLHLKTRTRNALHKANLWTIEHVLRMTKQDLLRLPHFGPRSYDDLCRAFTEYDIAKHDTSLSDAEPEASATTDRSNDRADRR